MELLFLSADAWRPEGLESDTVSLLINREIMVDTGWHPVHNLIREGISVRDIRTVLLTHLHQDHRMGLPSLLFYLLGSYCDLSHLQVMGVKGIEEIVHKALDYAGKFTDYSHAPDLTVHVLKPEDILEEAGLLINLMPSRHALPGYIMRFEDMSNGCSLVYSGDTAPLEDLALFAEGADVLIHEHSWGPVMPENTDNVCGHSSAEDAARIARDAHVKKLYLVHASPSVAEESLIRARTIFPETYRAKAGDKIIL